MIEGTITALVTPFTKRGDLDIQATERLVKHQLEAGVDGILVLGTTGEAPVLSEGERISLLAGVLEMVGDKAVLVAGTGTNSTSRTIDLTAQAQELGYRFALVVTPYYNKPTPEGLYQHYSLVASEVPDMGIIVYNVPGRTGVSIEPETVARLREDHPNIVAVKEASGSLDRVSRLVQRGITVLSGDDALTLATMAVGARGVISVASNIVPGKVSEMVKRALAGDFRSGAQLHHELYDLFKVLFLETNPGPVKAGLAMMGLCEPTLRPPLAEVSRETRERIKRVLEELSLCG